MRAEKPEVFATPIPWVVAGDFDGFFALFIDNLLLLMLIATICPTVCGLPLSLVFGRILPGAAFSIMVGNLFYAWQARRLARRTNRLDVTALPYGINTISVLSFSYYIMGPVYAQTHNSDLAWKMGLFACALTGVIEIAGSFFVDWIRRNTPRAALLCPLAGIALTFMASSFVFQIFTNPLVGLVPFLLMLIAYGGRLKLPGRVPAALVAVVIGIAAVEVGRRLGWSVPAPPDVPVRLGWTPPQPVDLIGLFRSPDGWRYFSVILPIGLLGVFSSIQILDSAEASGDHFGTRSSLLMNGVGTLCAAAFGSTFTTALYIGHPAWKALGARSAYSTLNGVAVMFMCLFGGITLVVHYVPLLAALGIMAWIGMLMIAQAFEKTPSRHAPAIALGLIPAIAGWVLVLIQSTAAAAGTNIFTIASKLEGPVNLSGIVALGQGSLISSMVLCATLVFVLDRQFFKAAGWAAVAAALSFIGIIHAAAITPSGIQAVFAIGAAPKFTGAYLFAAAILLLCGWGQNRGWLADAGEH